MQPMTQIQNSTDHHINPLPEQLAQEKAESKPRIRAKLMHGIRQWETTGKIDSVFNGELEWPAEDSQPTLERLKS